MFLTFSVLKKSSFGIGKILQFLMIAVLVVMILLYAIAMFPQFFRYKDRILEFNFTLTLFFIGLFLLSVLQYIFLNSKKKKQVGHFTLYTDRVEINGQKVSLSEIENLRFIGNDIEGDFRGYISKGMNNEIILVQKNGEKLHYAFQQTKKSMLKNEQEVLKKYAEIGIITKANIDAIFSNTNYY